MSDKIKVHHLERKAMLYVRQSSAYQVVHNRERRQLQYAMQSRVRELGWREVEAVDEDLEAGGGTTKRSDRAQAFLRSQPRSSRCSGLQPLITCCANTS